ncbi:MAG: hypothetical protein MJ058_08650 [Akkermansia sp.]|nr:hypothetical protein [Akkermansia sp.]
MDNPEAKMHNTIKRENKIGIAVYEFLISDKSNLPEELKSFLRINPPKEYAGNGFDYRISKDMCIKLQEDTPFSCDDDSKILHIAVDLALPDLLSVTYWFESKK